GMVILADMIELGQIRAGVVVGTEDGRSLVEGTIESLLANRALTRQDVKQDFASLTIGSGSAAIVVCDRKLCPSGHRLLGGAFRAETASHELCTGGESDKQPGDALRMQTDSEALLHAGVALAETTWQDTRRTLGWSNADVSKVFTHQVGRAHRKLLLERLKLDPSLDFPTVEYLGNTGAVALPTAWSLGIEQGRITAGDRVALLGIGSGLNALMLGVEW
ncbi:MAG TPA: 3-oxoacyl-[acyl-carrier-protein] synthase III C-terminal domain-containing protein, partial [Planctomycetaceae bacterium]|nr:3-oxoacyl-[acyl-carrier-protein] synthase III C-terminal domain-containing protein [Planctomycetaceae bacterium]